MHVTERFTNRADAYHAYRPRYPKDMLTLLQTQCGITDASAIADIRSGAGILSELFLEHGFPVFAVEPNEDMRLSAERRLHVYPQFTSVSGSAEHTTLPDGSVDFVTAGQAFHWLLPERLRLGCERGPRSKGFAEKGKG